ITARSVIVAAGSSRKNLGVPGEDEFEGRGVSHCASCDGPLMRGREVCVVGGGDSALDEALALAPHAARVSIVHRHKLPTARHPLQQKCLETENITFIPGTAVEKINGDASGVTSVLLNN